MGNGGGGGGRIGMSRRRGGRGSEMEKRRGVSGDVGCGRSTYKDAIENRESGRIENEERGRTNPRETCLLMTLPFPESLRFPPFSLAKCFIAFRIYYKIFTYNIIFEMSIFKFLCFCWCQWK